MNIIFDGNFLYWKSYSVFSTYYRDQDMSEVLKDKEKQQIFIRKCVIDMCATIQRFKNVDKVVFVFDSSSWRYSLYDDYKYSLTKVRDDSYKQFLATLDMFEKLLRNRQFIVSRVMGAEGDDLLYVWSLYFGEVLNEDCVIITGDSDIRQMISKKVSLFNNNSTNMKIYCLKENEWDWDCYFNDSPDAIPVVSVVPFEILLYKVLMGDTSDNIPKIKKGFGDVSFQKYLDQIRPFPTFVTENPDFIKLAQWIASKFSPVAKMDEKIVLGQVIFNLKMTWLNMAVYSNSDYPTMNGKGLLENMLDDVNLQKDTYGYSKKFTLEDFYGMLVK